MKTLETLGEHIRGLFLAQHFEDEILQLGAERVAGGNQADRPSDAVSLSADGRYVVFHSAATNLVPGDTNDFYDVFVHDRAAAGFTSLCSPGVDAVSACPCSNAPSAPGRGCDNSSATGGAILSASGIAYLSMDSLVFTTSGEKPTATSILLQGTSEIPGGLVRAIAGLLGLAPSTGDVAGPIGIAQQTGRLLDASLAAQLFFIGLLSINLAVLNILPFPPLDGGRVLIVLIEAVRRRRMSAEREALIYFTGFVVLIALVILISIQDIARLPGS